MRVIIDFDGTLTAEEEQVQPLADLSLDTLAHEIIGVKRQRLETDYQATRTRLLQAPHAFFWEVNGLVASYCNEGAFILNTTTLQTMLRENESYCQAVSEAYPVAEYDPVVDCTNDLFHRHTATLSPVFRPGARDVLASLIARPDRSPSILTNSLGDKVHRQLSVLGIGAAVDILGDTRQYEMAPGWEKVFPHPDLGEIQIWPISSEYQVDLRRPAYYHALRRASTTCESLVVVADTFSMPGALPLVMGFPFFLLLTDYTPPWCIDAVKKHPLGYILEDLSHLPAALDALPNPARSQHE